MVIQITFFNYLKLQKPDKLTAFCGSKSDCRLLSDTEIPEDVSKDLFGSDLAGDLAKEVKGFPDILRQQV